MHVEPSGIDHIGIAVHSIEERLPFYEQVLQLTPHKWETVIHQGVRIAFIAVGNVNIELLEPVRDDSPIAHFLAKKGEGVHHIALLVENIEERLAEIHAKNPAACTGSLQKGANAQTVAFLHPHIAGGVLYELCER